MTTLTALASVGELVTKWRREGVALLPPRDEREVVEALGRTGRPFSRDLVSLYRATGGMEDDAMNEDGLCLWRPERLVEASLKEPRELLLFMDFLLNSHCYGLRYEDEETSSVHIDYFSGTSRRAAGSLDEFIRIYLSDPSRIFL
jgi:hypothetical protein